MKHIVLIFTAFYVFCLFSCGEVQDGSVEMAKKEKAILIFIDKSASVSMQPSKRKIYIDQIDSILSLNVSSVYQGDYDLCAIKLCLIHGNTSGSGDVKSWLFESPAEIDPGLGGADKRRKQRLLEQHFRDKGKDVHNHISHYMQASHDFEASNSTDIWGSFEIMSRFFKKYNNAAKQVIFISDMVESMMGEERRNFRKELPSSKEEAEAYARMDFSRILKLYEVTPSVLKRAHVDFWLPTEPGDNNNYRYLRYYWHTLFGEFKFLID